MAGSATGRLNAHRRAGWALPPAKTTKRRRRRQGRRGPMCLGMCICLHVRCSSRLAADLDTLSVVVWATGLHNAHRRAGEALPPANTTKRRRRRPRKSRRQRARRRRRATTPWPNDGQWTRPAAPRLGARGKRLGARGRRRGGGGGRGGINSQQCGVSSQRLGFEGGERPENDGPVVTWGFSPPRRLQIKIEIKIAVLFSIPSPARFSSSSSNAPVPYAPSRPPHSVPYMVW